MAGSIARANKNDNPWNDLCRGRCGTGPGDRSLLHIFSYFNAFPLSRMNGFSWLIRNIRFSTTGDQELLREAVDNLATGKKTRWDNYF